MDTLQTLNRQIETCRLCPRLVAWREQVAREKRKAYKDQKYWGKPVPGFGDPQARVLVVGLAPGAHGSNRTGRQFTGDASGGFFYPALYRAGFASQTESVSRDDGLVLTDLYTAPVCRCVPPDNKPNPDEMSNCQPYLEKEIELLKPKVIVALGRIAFERVLRIYSSRTVDERPRTEVKTLAFGHAFVHHFPPSAFIPHPFALICSYHPSQQNTLTGRLTVEMFDKIWEITKELLER